MGKIALQRYREKKAQSPTRLDPLEALERKRAYSRDWQKKNKDYVRQWREKNPDRVKRYFCTDQIKRCEAAIRRWTKKLEKAKAELT